VASYFLDSSAVVKRYVPETGTAWIHGLTVPPARHACFVVRVTLPEVVAAITRRERAGLMTASAATPALADFQHDFIQQYLVVEVTPTLAAHAAILARTHGLRGYDAVQLAAALKVQAQEAALTLVSADVELNAAAVLEGLAVDDPNQHP
jgi:predicted nucleic acid-binding protein